MKYKAFLSITFLALSLSLSARSTTPLPLEEQANSSSLTLEQLKDSALANNHALRQKRISIDMATQQRREAFTNFFPNVSATGAWFNANRGMAKMDIDPSEFITPELGATLAQMLPVEALAALSSPMSMTMMKNGTIASVSAIQPLFTGGQIIFGNKLAKIGEEASQLQLQLTENEVEAQVEQYYWQLVSMQEKERTLDAVDTMLADIKKDVNAAVEAGVALRNDLLQVQLRHNEVESQRLKLHNGQELIWMLLKQLCGLKDTSRNSAAGMNRVKSFNLDEESSLPALEDSSLPLLPEYQLLQKNVEATTLQRKMEVGKHLPSVAVGAAYNYHNLMENDRKFGMVFATVNVPLSDWWGGSHAIKRKRLAEQQATEQLEENAEMLKIRMQKTWNDVVEAKSQLTLAQRSIEQADENLRVHRDTYHAGTATMTDLLQAQLLYQQACDQRTDAYIALQNALLAHRQATGQ